MGDLDQKRLATMDLPFRGTDEARRYKVIDAIVNIDMQDPAATLIPAAQNPADDKDGMRDFSPETVRRRRRDGFKFAHDILRPAFENRWARGSATRAISGLALQSSMTGPVLLPASLGCRRLIAAAPCVPSAWMTASSA
jgi:hypothetical protein